MILEMVNDAIKVNMKAGDSFKVSALRSLKAELENNLKDKTKKNEIDVVVAYKNKLTKALEAYNGYEDKQNEIKKEIEIINVYLPKQMTEQEVSQLVDETIKKMTGQINMGGIMKILSPVLKGKFDSKKLSELIQDKLRN